MKIVATYIYRNKLIFIQMHSGSLKLKKNIYEKNLWSISNISYLYKKNIYVAIY